MRYRTAKGRICSGCWVYVNELLIMRAIGKCIDLLLRDLEPISGLADVACILRNLGFLDDLWHANILVFDD